jgi:hypothetical protein
MKKRFILGVVLLSITILVTSCKSEQSKKESKEQVLLDKKEEYQCPMKCEEEKTYKIEGKCPVCQMKLREKEAEVQEND